MAAYLPADALLYCFHAKLSDLPQVLYPWRRIFQQMFNHDRMAGALYCMWDAADAADHAVVTELGARCRAITDDYASWQAILMHTLDMQVCCCSPVAPAAHALCHIVLLLLVVDILLCIHQ